MLRSGFRGRTAVGLGLVAGSLFLWWSCALTPLQRWYFWTYLNCSVQGDDAGLYSKIHWIYKTAPRRERQLTTDQDVVSSAGDRGDFLPVELSAMARKEGWTGLVRGPEEWIEIARLQPFLRQEFYDGQSLWKMLLTPLLWSVAALLFLLGMEEVLRNRPRKQPDYVWTIRRGPSPSLLTRCAEGMRSVRSVSIRTARALTWKRTPAKTLNSPATAVCQPAGKSAHGLPFFGVLSRIPGEKPLWKPTERDRLM